MTLQEIYNLAIEMGIKADPRGEKTVKKLLQRNKKDYEEVSEKNKKFFDRESITNPYSDTRVLYGDPKTNIKKILVGIDTDAAEILLADRLNQKGEGIDAVVGHHPVGVALAGIHDVMDLQVDSFAKVGIPINVLDSLMRERSALIKRKVNPANHNQIVDTARLLELPLINLHTVWDNMSDLFVKNYISKRDFDTVGELYDCLLEIPEFIEAKKGKSGLEIVSGDRKSRPGKIAIFFTGGTNPSKEIYGELAKAGIGTLIDMHIPEDALKEIKKLHINVIDAGHIGADSIGANLFLDELEKKGIKIVAAGGLIRVKRSKK